jgi:Concanavalin A-like lectin/glucanases superfamily/Domain of unknown function (DUF2341)
MGRTFLAFVTFAGACSFSANGSSSPHDAPERDAAADAARLDGNDVMVKNRRSKEIRFDNTKVSETLTDFVAWIDLNDTDIAARAQPDGRDIFFTAADGTTPLDHAIQIADRGMHHFAAWVRIPTLSNTAPTSIYVHYGDLGAASAPNPAGVFKASFAAVWHLDDTLPAATIADATGTHAGTPTLTSATTSVPGKLGNGLKFTGKNDQIAFMNPLSGKDPHTISVWVNQDPNLNHTAAIVVVGTAATGQARWLHGHYTNNSLAAGFYALDWVPNPAQVIDGAGWTYLTWVFEGANNKSRLYKNGVELPDSPFTPPGNPPPQINTTGTTGLIGFAPEPAYGTNNGYEGTIDELRIATVARTAGWVATEYANQSSPATFYTVGAEQTP